MVYVFSVLKEIKTMRLSGLDVLSELERNIYSVRFLGRIARVDRQKNKIVLTIGDDTEQIEATMYPKISLGAEKIGKEINDGDEIIVFAHLEPTSNICYIDFLVKPTKIEKLRHLAGLFTTYMYIFLDKIKKNEVASDKHQ